MALAALLYSLLGVAYEKLLKGSQQAPPNAEIMWQTSILGEQALAGRLGRAGQGWQCVGQGWQCVGWKERMCACLLALPAPSSMVL